MSRVTYFFLPDASPARYVKRCKYKPLDGNFCFTLLGGSSHRLKKKSPEALRIHLCWFRICEYIYLWSRLTLCKWSLQCFKGRDELKTGLLGRLQSKWKLTSQVNLRSRCRISVSLCFFLHFHFNSAFFVLLLLLLHMAYINNDSDNVKRKPS